MADKQVDMVTMNFFSFSRTHLVLIAKLKTSFSQNDAIIPYKVDTGSDGNILLYLILKISFTRATKQLLAATKNRCIVLEPTRKQKFHWC